MNRAMLTDEQAKIISMIVNGKTNLEIAIELNISEAYVKKKIRKIFKLFNVRNRPELVREAVSLAYSEYI